MGMRKVKHLGLAVLFGSVVLSGCGASNIAYKQYEDVVDIKTRVSAEGETSQEITLKGVSEPYQEVMVSSSVDGYLKEVLVDLGAYVERDQPLATLDDSDLNNQIEQAKTLLNLNKAEAEIAAMEQQISLNEIKVNLSDDITPDIKAQNYTIADLEYELKKAQKSLEQNQLLLKGKSVIQQIEIENIKSRLEEINLTTIDENIAKEKKLLEKKLLEQEEIVEINNAIESINQEIYIIERDLARAKEMLATRISQLKKQKSALADTSALQAKSNLIATSRTAFEMQRAETEIKLLEYHLNHLSVLAPANGYITGHNAIVGGATAANKLLFSITNIDQLYVNINVPEAFINKIKQDQEVTVTFPTIGKTVEGKITFISVMGNPNTQTFPVMVLIDNKDHEIRGGMAAQVNIVSKGK